MRRRPTEEIVDILVVWKSEVNARLDALESATREVRNLVIGLGIDTTEETERLDAHVSALEDAGANGSEDFPLEQQRDDWRARAERLLRERDEARAARDAALDQRDQSRAALAKIQPYAMHGYGCPARLHPNERCTCGLADALATTSEEREA